MKLCLTQKTAKSLKIALSTPKAKKKLNDIRSKLYYENFINDNKNLSTAIAEQLGTLLEPLVPATMDQLKVIYNDPNNVNNVNTEIWDPFFVMLWPYYDTYVYFLIAYYILTLVLVFVFLKYL